MILGAGVMAAGEVRANNYILKNIMKQLPQKITEICIAAYCIVSLLSGCTLIGYGIGSGIDSRREKSHSLRAGDDLGKYIGDDAIFHKRDRGEYEGIYGGTTLDSEAAYRTMYDSHQKADTEEIHFPLGSELSLQTGGSAGRTIEFHGFAHDGIIDEKNDVIRYKDISWIVDSQHKRIAGSDAKRLASVGELPLRDEFYCDRYKQVKISANDISDIVVSSKTYWTLGFTTAGVIADIICIAYAISGISNSIALKGWR